MVESGKWVKQRIPRMSRDPIGLDLVSKYWFEILIILEKSTLPSKRFKKLLCNMRHKIQKRCAKASVSHKMFAHPLLWLCQWEKKYWFYFPHWLRDLVSPIWRIFLKDIFSIQGEVSMKEQKVIENMKNIYSWFLGM